MRVQAKILQDRVYFGDFDKDNDIDPKTQDSGLNFFRFNLIGWILHQLGFAHKVCYTEGEKHGVVYLNPKIFKAWQERHRYDSGIDKECLNKAISQKDFERIIDIIYKNFANQSKINNKVKIPDCDLSNENQATILLPKEVPEEFIGTEEPRKVKGFIEPEKIEFIEEKPALQEPKQQQDVTSQISTLAFGKNHWAKLGINVENVPLPDNINEILKSPCPYSKKGETVEQTHVLVLKPERINEIEMMSVGSLKNVIEFKFPEVKWFSLLVSGAEEVKNSDKSCWMLMKKDVIEESLGKTYAQQQNIVISQEKYEVPSVLDVLVCIVAEYLRSRTCLFNNDRYTRCKENFQNYKVAIGDFSTTIGLTIHPLGGFDRENIGMVALRKL